MAAKLRFAVIISATILVAELVAGLISNSLALLSDAGHVFTDLLALSLSWFALKQAEKPATTGMTYGYHRVGILAAMVNSLSLTGISVAIFYEAARRWHHPREVDSLLMLSVATVGLLANLVVVAWLRRDARSNLNVRAAWWHAWGDSLSSVGVIVGGIVIYFTGRLVVDPLVSMVIGAIILGGAWGIVKDGVRILLEASPAHLDSKEVSQAISQTIGIKGVHDLHLWSIAPGINALSCHLLIDDVSISEGACIMEMVNKLLVERFNIGHSTLQLECDPCGDDRCVFHPNEHGGKVSGS
jgi:cobalt-zinc-cadmium efflux system protein